MIKLKEFYIGMTVKLLASIKLKMSVIINFLIDPIENDVYGLVKFSYDGNSVKSVVQHWTTGDVPNLVRLLITRFDKEVNKVLINGNPPTSFRVTERVRFVTFGLKLC